MKSAYTEQRDILKKQIYDEFVNGTAISKMKKMFNMTTFQIENICKEIFTKKKALIAKVKSDHPYTEDVNILDLENLMCASFTHLTVGDCIVENNKITNFKDLYL